MGTNIKIILGDLIWVSQPAGPSLTELLRSGPHGDDSENYDRNYWLAKNTHTK